MTERRLLNFVPADSRILREKCRELTPKEIKSAEVQNLIDNLFYTVKNSSRGVGLSANQVGRREAISVVATKPTPARPNLEIFEKVFVNTKIVQTFGNREPMWEGCLSTAVDENGESAMAQVLRFRKIEVEYFDRDGQKVREIVEGFVAQVLQHETDHLNGVLFTDLIDQGKTISYKEFIERSKQEKEQDGKI